MASLILASDFAEKIKLGGLVFLVGLVMVFVVLALLIGCIMLISVAFRNISEKKKNKAVEKSETVISEETQSENFDEIVAAITAAISCIYSESGKAQPNFVIRKVKAIKRR